jgi:hypothetical protein
MKIKKTFEGMEMIRNNHIVKEYYSLGHPDSESRLFLFGK